MSKKEPSLSLQTISFLCHQIDDFQVPLLKACIIFVTLSFTLVSNALPSPASRYLWTPILFAIPRPLLWFRSSLSFLLHQHPSTVVSLPPSSLYSSCLLPLSSLLHFNYIIVILKTCADASLLTPGVQIPYLSNHSWASAFFTLHMPYTLAQCFFNLIFITVPVRRLPRIFFLITPFMKC